jgi:hypothetical protein
MRLGSVLVTVFVLTASPVFAQGSSWGAKGGVNFATVTLDPESGSYDFRIGVVAGGYFTWPLGSRLEFQPEVLFSQEGAKASENDVSGTIALDMLTVPLLVRYRFAPPGHGLVVYGGPSIGLTLRARAVSEFGGEKVDLDISDEVEKANFGVAAGAVFERGRLSFDGRFTFGLTNLNAGDDDEGTIKSRVISALVGYRF